MELLVKSGKSKRVQRFGTVGIEIVERNIIFKNSRIQVAMASFTNTPDQHTPPLYCCNGHGIHVNLSVLGIEDKGSREQVEHGWSSQQIEINLAFALSFSCCASTHALSFPWLPSYSIPFYLCFAFSFPLPFIICFNFHRDSSFSRIRTTFLMTLLYSCVRSHIDWRGNKAFILRVGKPLSNERVLKP